MTVRFYNEKSGQWSIYWAGNHDGHLEAPMVGHFDQGTGTFLGMAEHAGKPVQVRFIWNQVSANTAHWQQAFSPDHGESWGEHGLMYHGHSLYRDQLHVPLMVRYPKAFTPGLRDPRAVGLDRLPATIASLTGTPAPRRTPSSAPGS
jgi:hypothetical protein